jgi:hypothetical protein
VLQTLKEVDVPVEDDNEDEDSEEDKADGDVDGRSRIFVDDLNCW